MTSAVGAGSRRPRGSTLLRRVPPFLRGPAGLLLPAFAVIAVMTAWPLIQLVRMSFQKFGRAQIFGAPPENVGFGNYTKVLSDPEFWQVLGRSVGLCVACVVATMGLGIGIAVLMTRLGRFARGMVSIGLLLAWAMPALSATTIFGWLFDTRRGLVNYILTHWFGLNFEGHSWLFNPWSFFFVAALVITWMSVPFVAFTTYAALTQVSRDVLEAASLDGAGPWQRFRLIVVPYIRSVLLVLLILQIIWDMRVFTQIFTLQTIGGIREKTNTIGVYIYRTGSELGEAGAISVILVIIMLAVSGYYIRSVLRQEGL